LGNSNQSIRLKALREGRHCQHHGFFNIYILAAAVYFMGQVVALFNQYHPRSLGATTILYH
jgi:hypothetical protein